MGDYEKDNLDGLKNLPAFGPKAETVAENVAEVSAMVESLKIESIEGVFLGAVKEGEKLFVDVQKQDGNTARVSLKDDLGYDLSGDRVTKLENYFANKVSLGAKIVLRRDGFDVAQPERPVSPESVVAAAKVEGTTTIGPEGDAVVKTPEIKGDNETNVKTKADVDKSVQSTLLNTANNITANNPVVNQKALEDIKAARSGEKVPTLDDVEEEKPVPQQPRTRDDASAGTQTRSGTQAIVDGIGTLVGGAAALVGGSAKLVGSGVSQVPGFLKSIKESLAENPVASNETPIGATVLPRLSEYRVDQVQRHANEYEKAHEQFWACDKVAAVRKEIEERARVSGTSVQDIMDKMKPNGEMADLYQKFNNTVKESPDALSHKQAMDKALQAWGKQHARASEEILNPEQDGDAYDSLKKRINDASDKMHKKASDLPAFEGEDKTHLERIKEIMTKIAEKLKEFVTGAVNFLAGRKEQSNELSI